MGSARKCHGVSEFSVGMTNRVVWKIVIFNMGNIIIPMVIRQQAAVRITRKYIQQHSSVISRSEVVAFATGTMQCIAWYFSCGLRFVDEWRLGFHL